MSKIRFRATGAVVAGLAVSAAGAAAGIAATTPTSTSVLATGVQSASPTSGPPGTTPSGGAPPAQASAPVVDGASVPPPSPAPIGTPTPSSPQVPSPVPTPTPSPVSTPIPTPVATIPYFPPDAPFISAAFGVGYGYVGGIVGVLGDGFDDTDSVHFGAAQGRVLLGLPHFAVALAPPQAPGSYLLVLHSRAHGDSTALLPTMFTYRSLF